MSPLLVKGSTYLAVIFITIEHSYCFIDKKFLAFFFRRLRVNDTGQYQDAFPFVSPCGKELNYIRCEDLPLVFTHLLDEQGDVIKDIGSHAEQLHHTAGKCDSKQPSSNIRNHDYKQPSPPPSPPLDFKTQLTDRIDDRNQPPANTDRNHDRSKNPSHRLTRVSSETLSYGGAGSALTIPFQPEKLCMLPGNGRVYHIGLEIVGGVGLVSSSLGIELSPFFRYEDGSDPERDSPVRFAWRGRDYELDNSVLKILEQRSPQS